MANAEWIQMKEGMRLRVHTDGERLMLVQVEAEAGVIVATHSHPHEQTTYVLSGQLQFTLDGKDTILNTGDAINVPDDVPHSVVMIEPCLILESFTPPRAEWRR